MCAAVLFESGACGVGRVLGCCQWVVGVFWGLCTGERGGLVVLVLVLICVRIGFFCRFEG